MPTEPTRRTLTHGGIAAILAIAAFALIAPGARATSSLPYRAFGSNLDAGQVVQAYDGSAAVGRTTADTRGNWILDIPATAAAEGDTISFTLDGEKTAATVTFQPGHFSRPPGVALRPGRSVVHPAPTPWTPAAPRRAPHR